MREQYESSYHMSRYQYVLDWLICKLHLINAELKEERKRPVIQKISGRIKTYDSVCNKLEKKKLSCDYETAVASLNDIVGVRAVCFFRDDINRVLDAIKAQRDIKIVKEKDYMEKPKKSGYQSIHVIVEVPVAIFERVETVRAEIQIRSFAMDYWAELDYQMCYKKSAGEVEAIQKEICSYSNIIAEVDSKMLELRKKIEKDMGKPGRSKP